MRPPPANEADAITRRRAASVALGSALVFAATTALVVAGRTTRLDVLLDSSSITHVPRMVRSLTKAFLHLADPQYALLLALGLGLVLTQLSGRARYITRAVFALVPWLAVTLCLKHGLDRELPGEGGGLGYPSGHTGAAVLLAALVVLALFELLPAGALRSSLTALAVAMPTVLAVVLLVGHFHWFSDILGGAALALACVAGATWFAPLALAALDRPTRLVRARVRSGTRLR